MAVGSLPEDGPRQWGRLSILRVWRKISYHRCWEVHRMKFLYRLWDQVQETKVHQLEKAVTRPQSSKENWKSACMQSITTIWGLTSTYVVIDSSIVIWGGNFYSNSSFGASYTHYHACCPHLNEGSWFLANDWHWTFITKEWTYTIFHWA